MRLPRFSLATAMLWVILAAVDLAALHYLYSPTNSLEPHFLVMSVLPMVNVIAIVGYRYFSRRGSPGRPFLLGFLAAGLAAMLGHVACDRMFPDTMFQLYSLPTAPFHNFCIDHIPWSAGTNPDGSPYWHFYALLSLFYCWPQFLVAGLGGLLADRLGGMQRPQSRN